MSRLKTREVIGDYEAFIDSINSAFDHIGIVADKELVMCDHLCYRVENETRYQEKKGELEAVAEEIGEVMVSGRLITTFELNEPLAAGGWLIPWLELPSPKDGAPYIEGLEHAEFVVLGSLADFRERHDGLPFNDKAMNKKINPELGLKIPEYNLSVKFHEIALGAVVRLEKRLSVD